MAEVVSQGGRAHDRTVVKLEVVRKVRGTNPTFALERPDLIDECRPRPGLRNAARVRGGNHIGGSFFDDAKAVELELADDRRLSGAGRAGDDEACHESRCELLLSASDRGGR